MINLTKRESDELMKALKYEDSCYDQCSDSIGGASPFYYLRENKLDYLKSFCDKYKFDFPILKKIILKINKYEHKSI